MNAVLTEPAGLSLVYGDWSVTIGFIRVLFWYAVRYFEMLFQIVSDSCQVRAFVGLFNTNRIYFAKPHKLFEHSKYRFYCALPLAFYILTLTAVYPIYVGL
jgi:hypothetical protein